MRSDVLTPRRLVASAPARIVALATAAALSLAGCSSGSDDPEAQPSTDASSSMSPSSDSSDTSDTPDASDTSGSSAEVSPTEAETGPKGVELTAQGTDLSFGDSATVPFELDRKRSSALKLTVTGARKGALADFKGFILDDKYKRRANYYYVDVTVKNVGKKNVGGAAVPLWGVNGDNTLLPAVNFTTSFGPCASTPLPEKFRAGRKLDTCLVYLSPDKGALRSVSFRPDQAFDPIEWTGVIKPPKADNVDGKDRPKKKPGKKTDKQN